MKDLRTRLKKQDSRQSAHRARKIKGKEKNRAGRWLSGGGLRYGGRKHLPKVTRIS